MDIYSDNILDMDKNGWYMMGIMVPYSGLMRILGGLIILTTLINTLLCIRHVMLWDHPLYNEWYFTWSPIFMFFGILLLLGSLWTDPRVVIVLAGVVAILWYVYIVRGGW